MTKIITVVIPTHNRNEDLERSVKSIFSQTKLPDELIVVDDGSSPSVTSDIFNDFSESKYMSCRLIRNEVPRGANHARNMGINAALGEFVAFLDDDDEFKNNKIETLLYEIKNNIDICVFYHPAEIHMVKENITYFSRPKLFSPGEDIFRSLLVSNKIGGTPMVAVRKSALIDVGTFNEQLPALQDYELWLRLARSQYKFKLIKKPLTRCHYVTNNKSISKSIAASYKTIALIEEKYFSEYLKLSNLEKSQYEEWKNKRLVHKLILNGKVFKAFQLQILYFFSSPKPKNLLAVLAIIMGPKFIYKMKAISGKLVS